MTQEDARSAPQHQHPQFDTKHRETETVSNSDKGWTHIQAPVVKNLAPSTKKAQTIQVRSRSCTTLIKQLPTLTNKHRWKQADHPCTQNIQLEEIGILQTAISRRLRPSNFSKELVNKSEIPGTERSAKICNRQLKRNRDPIQYCKAVKITTSTLFRYSRANETISNLSVEFQNFSSKLSLRWKEATNSLYAGQRSTKLAQAFLAWQSANWLCKAFHFSRPVRHWMSLCAGVQTTLIVHWGAVAFCQNTSQRSLWALGRVTGNPRRKRCNNRPALRTMAQQSLWITAFQKDPAATAAARSSARKPLVVLGPIRPRPALAVHLVLPRLPTQPRPSGQGT